MFKILKNLRKREIILICICFILVCGQVWLELRMPEYMSEITILVETNGSKIEDILDRGARMIVCAFLSLIIAISAIFLTSDVSARLSMNIREKIFKKIQDMSLQDIEEFSTNSLVTRTTNDITHVQMLVSMGLFLFIKTPVTAILTIYKICQKSWQWGLISIIFMMITTCVIWVIVLIVIPRFRLMQKLTDKMNGVIRENINGICIVRAFDAEEYERNKFEIVNDELTSDQLKNQKDIAKKNPILHLLTYLSVLGIYYIGALIIKNAFVVQKLALFGDMIVFVSYVMQVMSVFLMLSNIFSLLPRTEVSVERINEILDTDEKIMDGKIKSDLTNIKGKLEFKSVTFKYPKAKENVLENISFKINKGEVVAFVGTTGSGKTSLINIILRFFDVNKGEILLNGINIKEYSQEYLREKIGYIPQKTIIFKKSLKNNILYGISSNSAKKKENIENVIKIIQNNENIDNLNKMIAEDGKNLSDGQKQKISIARAILRNPEIYVFDDSFSGLSYGKDIEIIDKLKEYDANATILMIAQKISSVVNADKIIVLDKGKCVGIGKHHELMETNDVYRDIAFSQM